METPLVSVIIPTFNRPELLRHCLDSLARQTYPVSRVEVIVVDDGSEESAGPDSGQRTYPFMMRYLRVPHGGPSRARNAGLSASTGEIIALTEDDVVPADDWIERGVQHCLVPGVDAVEGRTIVEGTGSAVRRFEPQPMLSFIPCNLFIRREVYRRCGGYHEEYFNSDTGEYFREDAEFGFRLLDAGFRIIIASDVIVAHPPQFTAFAQCARHVRRYQFDALLCRDHPARYRSLIEVKTIGILTLHRPQHFIAWLGAVAVPVLLAGLFMKSALIVSVPLFVFIGCGFLFRYKYLGMKRWRPADAGFLFLPLIYLFWILKGCMKYRSIRVLF